MGNLMSTVITGANLSAGAADTFGSIGTVAAPPKTIKFRGVSMSAAPLVETADEAVIGEYKVEAPSLPSASIFDGPPRRGHNPGTNIGDHLAMVETRPFNIPMGPGEITEGSFTFHLPAPTTGADVQMAILHESNEGFAIPEWMFSNVIGMVDPQTRGYRGEAKSAIVGTAEVAMTAITFPSTAKILSSLSVCVHGDAFEAVEVLGKIDFETNFGFSPWQMPIPSPGVALGTAS